MSLPGDYYSFPLQASLAPHPPLALTSEGNRRGCWLREDTQFPAFEGFSEVIDPSGRREWAQ